jgi:hypothetical protein
MIIKISQSLRSFEMTRLILKSSTSVVRRKSLGTGSERNTAEQGVATPCSMRIYGNYDHTKQTLYVKKC